MLQTMKDQQRVEAIQPLMDSRLSVAQAAQVLGRSERQVWRLLGRAREDGLAGLIHGTRCQSRAPPKQLLPYRSWVQINFTFHAGKESVRNMSEGGRLRDGLGCFPRVGLCAVPARRTSFEKECTHETLYGRCGASVHHGCGLISAGRKTG